VQSKEDPKDHQETLKESGLNGDARPSDSTDTTVNVPDTTTAFSDTTAEAPKLILVEKEFEKMEVPEKKVTPGVEVSKEIKLGIGSIKDSITTISQLLRNDSLFVVSGSQKYEILSSTILLHNSKDEVISRHQNEQGKFSEELRASVEAMKKGSRIFFVVTGGCPGCTSVKIFKSLWIK
jgi:hypothetical protein